MIAVWVYSASCLQQLALSELVKSLGHRTVAAGDGAEVALFDLMAEPLPYPDSPPLPTLALLAAPENTLLYLLHQGYRGYLRPDQDKTALDQALQALSRGETWAERHVLARMLEPQHNLIVTSREQQVLDLLNLGLPNKKIAARLSISESTVKVHISSLLSKHGAKRRTELIMRHRHVLPRDYADSADGREF
jgi:DNA-binding CsgD family transcriptional regulator